YEPLFVIFLLSNQYVLSIIEVAESYTGTTESRSASLPITRDLTLAYVVSLVIALIMTVAAVIGLLFRTDIYPTDELILSFVPVDLFHLVVGLPILLGSMWLARRGKLIGLLCWPGALLYVLYSYITNLIGVPFGVLFLPYLLLVTLSAYTTIGLVASIDGQAVRQWLTGVVPAKAAGGILVVLTSLFIVINVANIVTALASQTPDDALGRICVWIADFTAVIPACLVGGLLLWRREALGYVGGVGLLLQYSLLLAGAIPCMVFPALYNVSPIDVTGIVLVLVWGVMCFIPFVLFVRGIVRS
ncbi:MAG TPA: hypothetical protein VM537_20470, partial [Anaerolineae bacterium]|nr:hypothetical protein [Anaerolineae bacterium]